MHCFDRGNYSDIQFTFLKFFFSVSTPFISYSFSNFHVLMDSGSNNIISAGTACSNTRVVGKMLQYMLSSLSAEKKNFETSISILRSLDCH